MKTNLNDIEKKVLEACKEAAKEGDTGVEFCFDELGWYIDMNKKQLRGYVGQLVEKGYLSSIDGGYFDFYIVTDKPYMGLL